MPAAIIAFNLNPSPTSVSPFAGQPAGPVGVLTQPATGTPAVYALTTSASSSLRLVGSSPLRRQIIISNNTVDYVAIGPNSTVTAATGFVIPGNTTVTFDRYTGEIWAIAPAAKTNDLRAWEITAVSG